MQHSKQLLGGQTLKAPAKEPYSDSFRSIQAETIGSLQEGYTRRSRLAHKQRDSGQRAGNSHSGVPSGLGKRFEFQALKICGLGGIRTGDDDILA